MRQHYNKNNSKVDYWTPRELFDGLSFRYGPFDVDVAADAKNALCETYIPEALNALCEGVEWGVNSWCNPPYDDVGPWVAKAIRHTREYSGAQVVMLLPARTCTEWFKIAFENAAIIEFISGRVNFGGPNALACASGAPFPSVVVVFRCPFKIRDQVIVDMIDRKGHKVLGKQYMLEDF